MLKIAIRTFMIAKEQSRKNRSTTIKTLNEDAEYKVMLKYYISNILTFLPKNNLYLYCCQLILTSSLFYLISYSLYGTNNILIFSILWRKLNLIKNYQIIIYIYLQIILAILGYLIDKMIQNIIFMQLIYQRQIFYSPKKCKMLQKYLL